MASTPLIRPVTDSDISDITDIYAYYAQSGSATFEWEAPTQDEMHMRVQSILTQGYPYLVLEDENQVIGYAYVSAFRGRKGWSWAVENSIYLAPHHAGKGYGRQLLEALIQACNQTDIRIMVAVISSKENIASIRLHQKMGFRIIGTMMDIGYKKGEWQDVVLMQKHLNGGHTTPPKI